MIVLDTHVWVWWVEDPERLSEAQKSAIDAHESKSDGIGICATSLWEVAKLVEYERLNLGYDLPEWFSIALAYPGVHIIGLTPAIAIRSTSIVESANRGQPEQINDPSDQIIIATAIINDCPLVTSDSKIIAYPDVQTIH